MKNPSNHITGGLSKTRFTLSPQQRQESLQALFPKGPLWEALKKRPTCDIKALNDSFLQSWQAFEEALSESWQKQLQSRSYETTSLALKNHLISKGLSEKWVRKLEWGVFFNTPTWASFQDKLHTLARSYFAVFPQKGLDMQSTFEQIKLQRKPIKLFTLGGPLGTPLEMGATRFVLEVQMPLSLPSRLQTLLQCSLLYWLPANYLVRWHYV